MKAGLAPLDSNHCAVLSKEVVGNGFEGFGTGVKSLAFVKGRYIAIVSAGTGRGSTIRSL